MSGDYSNLVTECRRKEHLKQKKKGYNVVFFCPLFSSEKVACYRFSSNTDNFFSDYFKAIHKVISTTNDNTIVHNNR